MHFSLSSEGPPMDPRRVSIKTWNILTQAQRPLSTY